MRQKVMFAGDASRLMRASTLAALVSIGAGVYFTAAQLSGAMTLAELKATLKQRR